jgi:predicted nucleic acid-binding protein
VARVVLSDASPLIGLAIVQGIGWLADLFGEVWIPPQVRDEVLTGRVARRESEIADALAADWLRIWSRG